VPTRFGRETRFKIRPKFTANRRGESELKLDQLKTRLLKTVLQETVDSGLRKQFRLAANEAAAIAWSTPYPLLVLPVLFQEKTAEVRGYVLRQLAVQRATEGLSPNN
jgi:hypothetical protein